MASELAAFQHLAKPNNPCKRSQVTQSILTPASEPSEMACKLAACQHLAKPNDPGKRAKVSQSIITPTSEPCELAECQHLAKPDDPGKRANQSLRPQQGHPRWHASEQKINKKKLNSSKFPVLSTFHPCILLGRERADWELSHINHGFDFLPPLRFPFLCPKFHTLICPILSLKYIIFFHR
jgi:hypothetical protein